MATYCECGHVWGSHIDGEYDEEDMTLADGPISGCLECECEFFAEVPAEILERGWS